MLAIGGYDTIGLRLNIANSRISDMRDSATVNYRYPNGPFIRGLQHENGTAILGD